MNNRKFNHIYNRIVKKENDIIGIVAYSIYKKNKTEYLKSKQESMNLEYLSDSDLEEFNRMSNTDSQIEGYKNEAKRILSEYSNILLSEKLHEIDNHYRKTTYTTFFSGVLQNFISSILFTLFLGLIAFILWSSQVGFEEVFEKVFKVEIVDKK